MENIPGELRKIPPVTKFILASTMAISVPIMLGILSANSVIFNPRHVFHGREVWRLWTSWFYTPSSEFFLFIVDVFLLYHSSNDLEVQVYDGHSADYAWQMILSGIAIMCLNIPLRTPVFSHPLIHFLIYRDSYNSKSPQLSILDMAFIPKSYLSLTMLALDLITGGPLTVCRALTGILVGHVSFLLIPRPAQLRSRPNASDEKPKTLRGWKKYATAPGWFQKIVPNEARKDDRPTRPGGNVRSMNGGGTMGFGYGLYNACSKCLG